MSMAELVAAGAPELPDGMFYRVRPSYITEGLFVSVRRRNRFVGSEELGRTVVYPSGFPSGLDAIVAACIRAVELWRQEEAARPIRKSAHDYTGDHDPKGVRR
ncbi:hypothetical protein ACWDX6_24040 [Streptomyces sp. NPDC003027]